MTGTTSDELTSLTDVFATIADVIDAPIPAETAEDSFSMLPVLRGEVVDQPIRPYLLQQGFGGKRYLAIRRGKWKYLAHQGSGGNNYAKHAMLKEYQLPNTAPEAPGQLYDLDTDAGETQNIALQHPEVVQQLQSLLDASLTSGRSRP